jgi:hypothetical protein
MRNQLILKRKRLLFRYGLLLGYNLSVQVTARAELFWQFPVKFEFKVFIEVCGTPGCP